MALKFGICNELFEGWEFTRIFQTAREIGYDGVEISPFTLGPDPAEIDFSILPSIRKQADAAGIEIIGLHWLLAKTEGFHMTVADESVRLRTVDLLIQRVRACAALGGKVMIWGSPQQRSLTPGVSYDQAWDYAVSGLGKVAEVLEEEGVVFCIEPLGPEETDFINTAEEACKLAQAVGSPNMKIILDVKAMSTEPRPVADTIRMYAEHAGHVHANDPNRRGPGFGEVDFVPIMQALKDVNYRGWISVEVFDFKPDPVTIARQSLANMQNCLSGGSR